MPPYEEAHIRQFPQHAPVIDRTKDQAIEQGVGQYWLECGGGRTSKAEALAYADAICHAVWAGLLLKELGLAAAKRITLAHNSSPLLSQRMQAINNRNYTLGLRAGADKERNNNAAQIAFYCGQSGHLCLKSWSDRLPTAIRIPVVIVTWLLVMIGLLSLIGLLVMGGFELYWAPVHR